MRRLLLLRHAKAESHDHGTARDRGRSLTERGRDDAGRVGRYIAEQALDIDLALVSDAVRARETFACAFGPDRPAPPFRLEPKLYDEDWQGIVDLVRAEPEAVMSLLLVGHNPDLAVLARHLALRGDPDALTALRAGLPTGSLVIIGFDVPRWGDLPLSGGVLDAFVTPAQLGGGPD